MVKKYLLKKKFCFLEKGTRIAIFDC